MESEDIGRNLSAGRYELSRHALQRIVERNISQAEIEEAGRTLELIEDYPEDKYAPSFLVLGFTENHRPLHLQVCYTDPDMLKVITVYEPSAGQWIDNRIRRQP